MVEVDDECRKLGIAIVGGHTGIYPIGDNPLNGGCAVWGFGKKEQVTPACNAKPGDHVIITKGPAIEAAAILASQAGLILSNKLGPKLVDAAVGRFCDMSVVKDVMVAAPNAHAMHDATEGGLLNGVYEVAAASGLGFTLYEDRIPVPDDIAAVCGYFKIDPLISISEGTLVIAAAPEKTATIISDLERSGIPAWDIGEITSGKPVLVRRGGRRQPLRAVAVDPFWEAFFNATGA